jgi:hypothetical protein
MASTTGYTTLGTDRTSFSEEFMKLAKLKDQGVLSQQEFIEMKAALISQAKRPIPVSREMQALRARPVRDDPVAIPMPGPAVSFRATKKGVILVIAVVTGFAAYGYSSQHYEKHQKQERDFAADAKRQVELMTEARVVAEASPQQMIDMHLAEEAAKLNKVQRMAVAAATVTVAAEAQEETENGKDRAEAACKYAVQESLNSPGSAEFLNTGVEMVGGKYMVTVALRPKSVFGALIRGTSHCVVLPDSFQVASITQA